VQRNRILRHQHAAADRQYVAPPVFCHAEKRSVRRSHSANDVYGYRLAEFPGVIGVTSPAGVLLCSASVR
jgi:hypothetical protein